jgi:putative ABC transport system substrate-binding protein
MATIIARRKLLTALGGMAAARPLAAHAQAAMPIVGYLGVGSPSTQLSWFTAFAQRLREDGWIEGRSIAILLRWAEGRNERFAEIAAEFVASKVNVIVTGGGAVPALKQATSTIPIVFSLANDPVGTGYVAAHGERCGTPQANVGALSQRDPKGFWHGRFNTRRRDADRYPEKAYCPSRKT